MINIDKLFEGNHWLSFHDCVFNAIGVSYTQHELKDVFKKLPFDTQLIAVQWTLGDTVFRDFAFEWLQKNK